MIQKFSPGRFSETRLLFFGLTLPKACSFIKKETLAQVFFFANFPKFLKTSAFTEHLPWLLLKEKAYCETYSGHVSSFWLCYKGISSFIHRISNNYFTNPQLFFRLDKIENDQILINFKLSLIGIFLFRLSLL